VEQLLAYIDRSSSRSRPPPTTRRSAPAPQVANACGSVQSAGCRVADARTSRIVAAAQHKCGPESSLSGRCAPAVWA